MRRKASKRCHVGAGGAREELVSFGRLYRDRGDSENIFDELKSLPSFPSGPSVALTLTPRAQLMRPLVEIDRLSKANCRF